MGKARGEGQTKGKKKTHSNKLKLEIIKKHDQGWSNKELMKKYNLTSSTISTFYSDKSRETLKKATENLVSEHCTVNNYDIKAPVLDDVETIIQRYIRINVARKNYLKEPLICEKARKIFDYLMDPAKGLFSKNGFRLQKGVPTPTVEKRKAMGKAYEIDTTINNITMLSSPSTSSTTDNVTRLSSSSTISTTDNVTRLSSPSTTSSTTDDTDDVTMLSSSKGKGNGKTTSTSTSTSENINNVTSSPRLNRYIFKASHGWYARCVVKRLGYIYVKKFGEADSADIKAAEKFVPLITEFMLKYFDGPQCIYNIDELGLFYKQILSCCVDTTDKAKQMKGFKRDKTRVSVLVGGNAAGDKLKPFLVGKSKNPHALRGVNRDTMPTTYKNSKKKLGCQLSFLGGGS